MMIMTEMIMIVKYNYAERFQKNTSWAQVHGNVRKPKN